MTRSRARLCCRGGKRCYRGHLEYDILAFCALLPALSTIFLPFFCALLPTFKNHFLLPYPGMVTVSCSCSFVCAVPGAAICQLSGGGVLKYITNVNCKQPVRKSNERLHQIYTRYVVFQRASVGTSAHHRKITVLHALQGAQNTYHTTRDAKREGGASNIQSEDQRPNG